MPSTDELFIAKPPKHRALVPVEAIALADPTPYDAAVSHPLYIKTPEPRRATIPEVISRFEADKIDLELMPAIPERHRGKSRTNGQEIEALKTEVAELRNFCNFALRWMVATRALELQGFQAVPWKEEMQRWLREDMQEDKAELAKLTRETVQVLGDLGLRTTELVAEGYILTKRPG
jgi:hypothetical protein